MGRPARSRHAVRLEPPRRDRDQVRQGFRALQRHDTGQAEGKGRIAEQERGLVRAGGGSDPGDRRDRPRQAMSDLALVARRRGRRPHRRHEEAVVIEPERRVRELLERPPEQPRGHHEQQRDRHLRHQHDAELVHPSTTAAAATIRLQGVHRVDGRRPECRRQARKEGRGNGDHRRVSQHAQVDREVEHDRHLDARELCDHRAGRPPGEHDAEGGAQQGQQSALDEERPNEPPARCPERNLQAQRVAARGSASQEAVGNVRACNEQHQGHHHEQRHEWRSVASTQVLRNARGRALDRERLGQGPGGQRSRGKGSRSNLRLCGLQGGSSRVHRLAGSQPEHDSQPRGMEFPRRRGPDEVIDPDGQEQVEGRSHQHAMEPGGCDADHGGCHTLDEERAAYYVGRPAETTLPEAMADDRDRPRRASSGYVVSRGERTAGERPHPKGVEEVAAHPLHVRWLRLLPDRQGGLGPCQRAVEQMVVTSELVERGVRKALLRRVASGEGDQTIGLQNRQAAKEQAVHQREDRGVRANAQREGQDDDGRDEGRRQERANAEPQVLPGLVEPSRAARIATDLLDLLDAAELDTCSSLRLPLGHSGPHVVGHLTLDVVAQLGVELPLHPVAIPKAPPPGHGVPEVRRIRPTASASRIQLSVCSSNCARPLGVSR